MTERFVWLRDALGLGGPSPTYGLTSLCDQLDEMAESTPTRLHAGRVDDVTAPFLADSPSPRASAGAQE